LFNPIANHIILRLDPVQAEWKGYIEAERAEQQRRAVVERAKPAARAAEATEREAVILKQQATESEFHAQVLENRARALIRESEEMADLSLDTAMEAEKVSGEQTACTSQHFKLERAALSGTSSPSSAHAARK